MKLKEIVTIIKEIDEEIKKRRAKGKKEKTDETKYPKNFEREPYNETMF